MTKSNLALIDRAADDAFARESQLPPVISPIETEQLAKITIAGFQFLDPATLVQAQEKAKVEHQNRFTKYLQDRDSLRQKLAQHGGLEAKAYLPGRVWDRLCAESGLIQLHPTTHSRVAMWCPSHIKALDIDDIAFMMIFNLVGWTVLSMIVAGLVWGGPALLIGGSAVAVGWLVVYAVCGAVTAIGTRENIKFRGVIARKLLSRDIDRFLRQPRGVLLKKLLTTPPNSDHHWWQSDLTLVLPTPPAEVAARLLKVRDMAISVAAVPEAIQFKEDLKSVLFHSRERAIIASETRPSNLDPIPYIIHGRAVAIIDQFGEFPIEQELVERVMTTAFAP